MLRKIKSLPNFGAIAVSYGSMFIEGSLSSILVALMAILAAKFGKTNGDIATLLSLKGLGTLLVLFVAGRLSDQHGRKLPIALGSLLFSVFMLGFIFTSNFYLAGIFAFIAGLAHGFMDTPGMSLLFDSLSGNTGPALSVVQVFFAGGSVLTTMLTSIFIRFNFDYRFIFAIILSLNLLLFLIIIRVKYPPVSGKVEVKTYQISYEKEPRFLIEGSFLFLNTLIYAGYQAISSTWLPTFLVQVKGFDLATAVSMMSLSSIGAVLGALFFAWVLRHYHSTKIMTINPLIAMLVLMMLVFVKVKLIVMISVFGLGFLMSTYFSMSINMGGELFPKQAGTATGAVATASMLGSTIIVWLTGRLIETTGVNNLMVFGIALLLVLAISSSLFRIHYLKLKPGRR